MSQCLTVSGLCMMKKLIEVPVCRQAFISLHGIDREKFQFLLTSLKMPRNLPKNLWAKLKNHKITDERKKLFMTKLKA